MDGKYVFSYIFCLFNLDFQRPKADLLGQKAGAKPQSLRSRRPLAFSIHHQPTFNINFAVKLVQFQGGEAPLIGLWPILLAKQARGRRPPEPAEGRWPVGFAIASLRSALCLRPSACSRQGATPPLDLRSIHPRPRGLCPLDPRWGLRPQTPTRGLGGPWTPPQFFWLASLASVDRRRGLRPLLLLPHIALRASYKGATPP